MKSTKKNPLTLLCLFILIGLLSFHARTQTWKNYTCMKSVAAMTVSNSTLWAATGGGVFSYTPASGIIKQYNNSEGVPSNNLTAIAVDTAQRIWVGGLDGSIGVYNQAGGSWTAISDIKNIDATIRPQKRYTGFFYKRRYDVRCYAVRSFGVPDFRLEFR